MLYKQLVLAATAAAMLVVPEVPEIDGEIISTLPMPDVATRPGPAILSGHQISVPCYQCTGDNAMIEMDFFVEDGSRLTLNGFELYPSADLWHDDLIASIEADGESKEQILGYGLFVGPELVDSEQQLSLVTINLQVLQVGGVFVIGVPKVAVKLIKDRSGDIIIGSIEIRATPDAVLEAPHNPLLRIKEKVEEFWKKLSNGCGRHRQNGNHSHGTTQHSSTYEGKEGSPPYRHDSPHAHPHNEGRRGWIKLIRNIVRNIIIPILAGILAGLSVAFMTMAVCSFFALVFRARRGSCSAARQSKAAPSEPAFADEKAGLMEAQDAPPEYENDQQAK